MGRVCECLLKAANVHHDVSGSISDSGFVCTVAFCLTNAKSLVVD